MKNSILGITVLIGTVLFAMLMFGNVLGNEKYESKYKHTSFYDLMDHRSK
ncbi:MAG: hypothetical protein KIC67_18630 [Clostridium butyricum]|nr:hypothetical protein [Clostridium butyricum]